jgi:hypothetical protein
MRILTLPGGSPMSFVIEHLRFLHQEMKLIPVTIATFDFEYNEINCSCIFETDYTEGFSITFFKIITGESLKLPVHRGYMMDTYIENKELYFKFWKYFDLKAKNGEFSMNSFYERLNQSVPQKFSMKKNYNRPVLAEKYDTEKKDRPYFLGFKNWKIIKAKNPNAKGTRSAENLNKTKRLYPLIYEATKNYDISVRYTDHDSHKDEKFEALLHSSFNNDGIV